MITHGQGPWGPPPPYHDSFLVVAVSGPWQLLGSVPAPCSSPGTGTHPVLCLQPRATSSPHTSLQSTLLLNGNEAGRFHRWLSMIAALYSLLAKHVPQPQLLSVSGIVRVLSGSISLCQLCLGGNSKDLPSEIPLKGKKSFICSQACLSPGLLWLPVALSSPRSVSSWQRGQMCLFCRMGSWPVSRGPSSPSSAREEHSLGLNHCLGEGQLLKRAGKLFCFSTGAA